MMLGDKKKILVVEDDSGIAYLQSRCLERAGYAVFVATTADEAFDQIRQQHFDLILLDYLLPEQVNGLEFHTKLKADGYDIPVIIVTGFSQEGVVVQALRAGIRDFVLKAASDYIDYLPVAVERVLKQVALEQRLEDSEALFQSFMDNSPAVAFIKDEQGRYVYGNQRFQQEFQEIDWYGKSDDELWAEEPARMLSENDKAVLAANQATEVMECLPKRDGSTRYWHSFKFPIPESFGRRWLGGMAIDITERKATEDALRKRDELLRQAQKMEALGTLAGGVAHEFNNLLQAVQGYTRYAMEGLLESEQRYQDLEQVLNASRRAADLTSQLLSFGRRQPIQCVSVQPNDLVQDLMKMIRPLIGELISVELELSPEAPAIEIDASQMQQILMNLCVNARDAMPQGGLLSVKTDLLILHEKDGVNASSLAPGRYLSLIVSDRGSGILPEHQTHIFEPFFTTKDVGQGTGLGLATVYGIVQQHQGAIQLQSEIGVGTSFRIYLPAGAEAAADSIRDNDKQPARGREVILVAEDEQLVRDLTLRILQDAGYQTIAAKDGQEAAQLFEKNADQISLSLLDLMMPRKGGREASEQIRQIRPDARVIFCTGYEGDVTATGSESGEGTALIRKPFDPLTLLDAVRGALDRELSCQQ